MKTNEKKVVFLNEVKSPYIEQAIFVLKNAEQGEVTSGGIVEEAERIVAQYAQQHFSHMNLCEEEDTIEDQVVPTFEFSAFSRPKRLHLFWRQNRILLLVLAMSVVALAGIVGFIWLFL